MQPEARLREDIARKGKVGVDAQSGLVLDAVGDGARIAAGGFGFWRYRDVVVVLPEKGGTLVGERGGVREDDGDGEVEDAESGKDFGAVGSLCRGC